MFGYWLARGANSPGEMLPMGEDDLAGVPSLTQPNENLSSTQEAVTEPINCFENDCVVEALRWQNDDWDEYGNASLCDQSTDSLKESIVSVISHMSDDLVKLAIPAHIDESCLASQPDDIVGEDDNATVLPVLGSAQGDGTDEWTMDDLGHSMEMQMASDAATLARIREDYISEYGDFDVGVALVPKPGHPNELPPEPIHPNEPPPQPIHEDCKLNSTGEKTAVLSSNKSSYRTLLPKTQDINKNAQTAVASQSPRAGCKPRELTEQQIKDQNSCRKNGACTRCIAKKRKCNRWTGVMICAECAKQNKKFRKKGKACAPCVSRKS